MKTLDYIHLDASAVSNVVASLKQLLADYQVFYTNLRGFHWNIKGHGFFVLHGKFEDMYNNAAEKVDELAAPCCVCFVVFALDCCQLISSGVSLQTKAMFWRVTFSLWFKVFSQFRCCSIDLFMSYFAIVCFLIPTTLSKMNILKSF